MMQRRQSIAPYLVTLMLFSAWGIAMLGWDRANSQLRVVEAQFRAYVDLYPPTWDEVTEFVPDMPKRMSSGVIRDSGGAGCPIGMHSAGDGGCEMGGTSLTISNEPAGVEYVSYSGSGALSVNVPSHVRCLYWDGYEVAEVMYASGKKQHVRCRHG